MGFWNECCCAPPNFLQWKGVLIMDVVLCFLGLGFMIVGHSIILSNNPDQAQRKFANNALIIAGCLTVVGFSMALILFFGLKQRSYRKCALWMFLLVPKFIGGLVFLWYVTSSSINWATITGAVLGLCHQTREPRLVDKFMKVLKAEETELPDVSPSTLYVM